MNRRITSFFKIPESLRVPILGGIIYKASVQLDNKSIKREEISNPLNKERREEIVIASLTSYPARINYVHLAIKSLMVQTYKPDRIVLYLAKEQFPTMELPKELTELEKYGLEIIWMHDIYGHKKYFYPVKNQSENEVVITYDDDIIYSPRSIERLMNTHQKYPHCLVCERGQTINPQFLDNPGRWDTISNLGVKKPTYSMNPSPGGGCLIPYGAFHKDAVNEEKIRALAYKNDDRWYMFMCAQNETKMIKTRKYHRLFSLIVGSQIEQMATENVTQNHNATVMKKLIEEYPEGWSRIRFDR